MQQQRICTADGCERPHLARGLCRKHYRRWQRTQPQDRERDREYDRKRRKTPAYQATDRERQRKQRVRDGKQPRPTAAEMERRRAEKRRQARLKVARRKLDRAALGTPRERATGPTKWIAGPCPGCDELFVGRSEVCSSTCRKRVDRWADRDAYGNHRERARRYGVKYEPVNVAAVMERDGYRCQMCGRKTAGQWPALTSASLDHIVPLSVGGSHTYGNVQCACLRCNVRKGASARNDQLRLNIPEKERGKGTVELVA